MEVLKMNLSNTRKIKGLLEIKEHTYIPDDYPIHLSIFAAIYPFTLLQAKHQQIPDNGARSKLVNFMRNDFP